MGEIADGLINGDFDFYTGEYIGRGKGFPRSAYGNPNQIRKSQDLRWKKIVIIMNNYGIKPHLHPQVLKDFGCTYSGRKPLRNACFEVLNQIKKFNTFLNNYRVKQNSEHE